ncbi:MAG: FecR family protein [Candidatus Omnitrophica bacterium]|nr:FecR family protein [Candidatus Omnitrophota bacterium]
MSGPSPIPAQAQSVDLIGVAAAVRGNVELSRMGTVGKVIESGENIFLGDQISTGDKGRLQILLLDETVFTIGSNSAMVIDQFVYDPANHDGEIKAKIVKGTFRFVTGQIAHKKPSRMRVDLPAGSIGVRGTIVAGIVEGMHSFVALMGPGDGHNAGANQGSIGLSNTVNGQTFEQAVNRTGYGSVIDGTGSAPSPAFQVPAEQMNSLVSTFSPGPSDQGSEASGSGGNSGSSSSDINVGSVSAAGGENTFSALDSVNDLATLEETISSIGNETDPARQNNANDSFTNTSGSGSGSGSNPGTTPSDNRWTYSVSGTPLYSGPGGGGAPYASSAYEFQIEVNYTGKTFGGENSFFSGQHTIPGNAEEFKFNLPESSFSEIDPGSYTYTYTFSGGSPGFDIAASNNNYYDTGNVKIQFLDASGLAVDPASDPVTVAKINLEAYVEPDGGAMGTAYNLPADTDNNTPVT